jgi:hypothetical protein
MAGKILDNGTLVTLGLVGAVAAAGAVVKRGSGSRSHTGGETAQSMGNTLEGAREDLVRVLKRGPGTIRHESDKVAHAETYSFTNINAAAIRAPGGWIPATYRSSYDNHTGMNDGDYKEVGPTESTPENALLIAIEHALHDEVGEGAMARGGFNRKDQKVRPIFPWFASAVALSFDRQARYLDSTETVTVEPDGEGGYTTEQLPLGTKPVSRAIRTPSIVGSKVRDGWVAKLHIATDDPLSEMGTYPTASAALIGAMISLVMESVKDTVHEEGRAASRTGGIFGPATHKPLPKPENKGMRLSEYLQMYAKKS